MSEGKLHIEIHSPLRIVYKDDIDSVIIPGEEGDFEILPSHFSFIAAMRIGELIVFKNEEEKHFAIHSGTAEVRKDSVSVLTKSAEAKEEIDIERALNAKKRAEERLRQARVEDIEIDINRAEVALKRSLIRLQVAGYNLK